MEKLLPQSRGNRDGVFRACGGPLFSPGCTAWAVLPQSGNRWSRLVRCMDWTLTKSCSQLMNIFLLKKRMYDYQNVSLATGGRGYVLVFFLGYGKLLWVGRLLRFLTDWGARVTLIYAPRRKTNKEQMRNQARWKLHRSIPFCLIVENGKKLSLKKSVNISKTYCNNFGFSIK